MQCYPRGLFRSYADYDQDPGSYIKRSVKLGAAQQFIRDINRGETTQESLVVERILIQSRQNGINGDRPTLACEFYLYTI